MKTLKTTLVLLLVSITLFAQEPGSVGTREISISTYNLIGGTYDLTCKSAINSSTFFTVGLIDMFASYDNYRPSTSNNFPRSNIYIGGGLRVGVEKRNPLSDLLTMMYGLDLRFSSGLNRNHADDPNLPLELRNLDRFQINTGIGLNLGLMANVRKNLFFSAEITPSLIYSYAKNERLVGSLILPDITNDIDLRVSNQTIRLSLIYRWEK